LDVAQLYFNENVIKAIIAGGVNLIDTAESYANGKQ